MPIMARDRCSSRDAAVISATEAKEDIKCLQETLSPPWGRLCLITRSVAIDISPVERGADARSSVDDI